MTIRTSIPEVAGVQDPKAALLLGALKSVVEEITGRAPKFSAVKTLGPDANFAGVVSKVNELIARIQSQDIPQSRSNTIYLTTVELTGDVTGSGTSSIATTIGANKVLDSMLRQSAALSVIGRASNSTGDVADISATAGGNTVLLESSSALSWAKVPLTTHVTGTLPLANGGSNVSNSAAGSGTFLRGNGTGFATSTLTLPDTLASGDLLYASSANTGAGLAIGASAGQMLRSTGALPAWSTNTWPDTTTINQVLYATGSNAIGSSANLVFNGSQMGVGGALSTANGLKVTSTIANTASAAILNLQGGATASSGTVSIAYGALAQPIFTMTGQAITQAYGMFFEAYSTPVMATGATLASAAIGSLRTRLNLAGTGLTGTISQGIGLFADQPRNDGTTSSVTFTTVSGIQVQRQDAFVNAGVTVTSARGIAIADNTSATNNVNLLIGTTTSPSGTYSIRNASAAVNTHTGNSFFGGTTTPTAKGHFGASTTAASSAPWKAVTGALMTTAEAGAFEYVDPDFFLTIAGPARKGIVLDDGARLTSGRVPFATTNGRLTDDADMTFATDTLTVAKIIGSTSITNSSLTSGRVVFSGASGIQSDSSQLTFGSNVLTVSAANGVAGGLSITQASQNTWDVRSPAGSTDLRFSDVSSTVLTLQNGGNIGINTSTQFGSGTGVISVLDATVAPSANPTGAGILYATGGAGTWRGSGGTISTFAPT